MRIFLTLMIVGLMSVPALARGDRGDRGVGGEGERAARQKQGERRAHGPRDHGHPILGVLRKLDLTEEQKQKVQQIMKGHRESAEQWREQNREKMKQLLEQLRQAKKSGDEDKAEQIKEQIKTLTQQDGGPGDLIDDIKGVLTDEQKAKLEEMRPDRRPGGPGGPGDHLQRVFGQLDLTDAQKEKIHAIMQSHHEKMAEFRKANEEKLKTIHEQMRQARKDRDREKMKQLMEQMRQLREGGPERGAVMEEIMAVLTPEQQAKLKEIRKDRPRGEGRDRPGDRGPGRRGPRGGGDRDEGGESEPQPLRL